MNQLRVLFFGLLVWIGLLPAHNITIEQHEIPLVIDTYARYRQNQSLFTWMPFDSTRQVWDMTVYPGGLTAKTGLRHYLEGRSPAPESMSADPPVPQVCEFDTAGSGSESEVYLYLSQYGLYADGIDFSQGGFRFLGNYRPDGIIYSLPLYYGASWITAWSWQYEIAPGIPYQATEQHQKRVVAKGKVKVPMSGDYFWPCLVIKDYMVYSDNMGTNDRRWIYEWVVPGHFAGANGVCAAASQNGASPDFINVELFLQVERCSIPGWDLRPPQFASTRSWPDTSYAGPFTVWSTITDNVAVGAESLFYRVNQGPWVAVPADSQRSHNYYFTIPAVTPPARVDYYLWAKDSFCVANQIDFWTTWPVCSPESTMLTFNVNPVGATEPAPSLTGEVGLTIHPNPACGQPLIINLNHPEASRATMDIYCPDGRLIRSLKLVRGNAGYLTAMLEPADLAAGIYFYRCTTGKTVHTGRLVLLH
ncbi:MAG: T9SS type A sorting domain-containing protein [bacterium]